MIRSGYLTPYPDDIGDTWMMRAGEPGQHRGVDTAPGGFPALFPADGVIVGVKRAGVDAGTAGLGNMVVAQAADGKYMGIAHLASIPAPVVVGMEVRRLEAFGPIIGNTGSLSNGRHMHSTLGNDLWGIITGHVQDPLAYYKNHPPTGAAGGGATPITEDEMSNGAGLYKGKNKASIYYQEKPHAVFVALSGPEWQVISASGMQYSEIPQADMDALLARWGSITPTDPLPVPVAGTVKPDPAVLEELQKITAGLSALQTSIAALPAEIDAYSDGRK